MFEDIQTAIPIGFLLSFMVGPVFFVLLETSVIRGFKAAMILDLGVVLADLVFVVIAYLSSYQLLEHLTHLPGIYIFGGAILGAYGLVLYLKKVKIKDLRPKSSNEDLWHLFIKGFLLNFVNIGVLIFWLGLIVLIGPTLDNEPSRIGVFFSTVLLSYLAMDVLKVILAKQLKSKLTLRRIVVLKKSIGLILVGCGIVLIVKGFLPKDQLSIEKGIELLEKK